VSEVWIPWRYKVRWFFEGFFFRPVNRKRLRRQMDEITALNYRRQRSCRHPDSLAPDVPVGVSQEAQEGEA
jgi:hypothetical protein